MKVIKLNTEYNIFSWRLTLIEAWNTELECKTGELEKLIWQLRADLKFLGKKVVALVDYQR